MKDVTILELRGIRKPGDKFLPKEASTVAGEELRETIQSMVSEMKTMIGTDLVNRSKAV